MQNVQQVKEKPRDEGPGINVITRSGIATIGVKEKVVVEPLRKVSDKKESLDLQKEKETFLEARMEFARDEASNFSLPPTKPNVTIKTSFIVPQWRVHWCSSAFKY